MRNECNIALLYQPKLLVSLLVLGLVCVANSQDAKGNRNTGSDLHHHGSSDRQNREGYDSAPADDDLVTGNRPFSPVGCFEDSDSKCPNSALPAVPTIEQSAVAGVASSEDTVRSTTNYRAAAVDMSNTLELASAATSPDLPPPPPPPVRTVHNSRISAVLVLTLKDAHLATLLMTTLRACGAMEVFRDFFVVVPGDELVQIEAILGTKANGNGKNTWSFSLQFVLFCTRQYKSCQVYQRWTTGEDVTIFTW